MNLYETNPNTVDFYIVYLFVLAILYAVIMLIQNFMRNRNENSLNVTIDYYGNKKGSQVVHDVLTSEQREIRFKYLLVSVLVKAATWVKAPYLFALYNRVHGFTRSEIGYLMAVDNISSLLLGPLLGGLADIYGRKKFCVLYCIAVICHISMRITGDRTLAWFAQIMTGVCSCLLDSAFESWINFEANFLFPGLDEETAKRQKNSYLREIFTKQISLDCFCSIILTGVATILYAQFNIFYPFYACMIFAAIAAVTIMFLWNENQMDRLEGHDLHKKHTFWQTINFAWNLLKNDKALLCVGGIESCFKISLALFLFIWTPLLEETVGTFIHPGAIFACFMLARLIGSEGISGMFSPLFSTLRAQMIPEKLRSTIMNFFRMPINVCSILCLIGTSYLTTYQICLICSVIMFLATALNAYLFKVHTPPDVEKRTLTKTSEFMSLYEKSKMMVLQKKLNI